MIKIRLATESDLPFIFNAYLRSNRNKPEATHMINDVYYPLYSQRLKDILADSDCIVACHSDDDDQILGYAIIGDNHGVPVLHWIYTKLTFRKMGVARALIQTGIKSFGASLTLVTHTCRSMRDLCKKYKLVYTSEVK